MIKLSYVLGHHVIELLPYSLNDMKYFAAALHSWYFKYCLLKHGHRDSNCFEGFFYFDFINVSCLCNFAMAIIIVTIILRSVK